MFILDTSHIFARATAQEVIKTLATGGVCCPIARLRVTTRPKCTGSIPAAAIKGTTMGTTNIIAAAE